MDTVMDDATIRPYLLFSTVGLDDSLYLTEVGGGLNIRKRITEQLNIHVNGEYTVRNFKDNSSRPNNSGQDGQLVEFKGGFDYAFRPQTFVAVEALYRSDSTVDGAEGSHDIGVRGSLTQLFDPGIAFIQGGPISFTAAGAYERSTFNDPDPAVDPAKRRRDHEARFSFVTTVPILRNLAAVMTVGYTNVDSNIVNFDYHNFYYSVGASLSF